MSSSDLGDGSRDIAVHVGDSWQGQAAIRHLFVFGASYCDVGYRNSKIKCTPEQPLGVEYPGLTYAEPDTPNWVGYLVKEYKTHEAMVAYCYAVGGTVVEGVKSIQIERWFLEGAGKKPSDVEWTAMDSLFATWIGINDIAYNPDIDQKMATLFAAQAELYEAGARNFLFITVPPMERSPGVIGAGRQPILDTTKNKCEEWNRKLVENARSFTQAHPDATAMIYSSHHTFTQVLDNPGSYDFVPDDVAKMRGAIWIDNIHPTTAMHKIIAREIGAFLGNVPAFVAKE